MARKRALIRTIPVKSGRAHTRKIKTVGVPDDQPIIERVTRGRYKKLPPAMQTKWVKASIKALKKIMPKADPDEAEKFYSPAKGSPAAAGEAGPSNLCSPQVTQVGKKKRNSAAKKLGFPVTPPGLPDSKRDGIIAGIYVDTPPGRRPPS